MIRSLDHIAIAVSEISEAVKRFSEDLGLAFDGQEDVPSQKTTTAFLRVGDTHIELIHPMNGEGPVAESLKKRGPGLHHLCFSTDDLDGDVARLRARGWQFTSAEPTAGAGGSRVIFIHPKSTGGVLIELAQHADHECPVAQEPSR
jgi:methylmalonyl-CoA/ethylmalonyl-CoA epimerase